jgi:hypothetical protein
MSVVNRENFYPSPRVDFRSSFLGRAVFKSFEQLSDHNVDVLLQHWQERWNHDQTGKGTERAAVSSLKLKNRLMEVMVLSRNAL